MPHNICFYLQHYLSPSMTFIYRQLNQLNETYGMSCFVSNRAENLSRFPFQDIFFKQRNFLKIKNSRITNKLLPEKILSRNPKLSSHQKRYFGEILKKNHIKLIHAHFGPSGMEILPIARKLGIPLLVTFHGYDASSLLKYKDYKKNLTNLFDYSYIITVSDLMKNTLIDLGADEKRIFVIHCGIPIHLFKFCERESIPYKVNQGEKIIFSQVANFVEKKGHNYTLHALAKALEFYPNLELKLAGGGPLQEEIQFIIKELKLSSKVELLGTLNEKEVRNLFFSSDVFLHHSIKSKNGDMEGIPTVIMEAMASGLPVISTNHSGIPELITDGINGYLVPEKDISSYVKRIVSILNNEQNFGPEARKTVEENFNLQLETEKISKLYQKIINYQVN